MTNPSTPALALKRRRLHETSETAAAEEVGLVACGGGGVREDAEFVCSGLGVIVHRHEPSVVHTAVVPSYM